MRHAVLLGKGKYADEIAGFSAEEGPRKEFVEIALATSARILSLMSGTAYRDAWCRRLFGRVANIGSAVKFALSSRHFDSCYVTGEDIGIPVAILLKMLGWKGNLICVVHNITPRKAFLLRRIGPGIFTGLITVSEQQRSALITDCAMPADKVFFRYVWVDEVFFSPSHDPARADDAQPVVMACGAEGRDYALLNDAASRLDVRFEVYGHGFFGEDRAHDGAISSNFHRMPRVPFCELVRAYRSASAVALPLNNVAYAAGVTGLVEAMACGKAVIVTSSQGLKGYLAPIEPALLIQPASVDHAVDVLTRFVARSSDENTAAGERNRRWVVENCALADYVRFVVTLMTAGSRA